MATSSLLCLEDIQRAVRIVEASPHVDRTNLLRVNPVRYGVSSSIDLYLKLESQQNMGSFKIRGIVNQMETAPQEVKDGQRTLITMSAGNYGRSFAYMCKEKCLSGKVLMPSTAPKNRVELIQSYGLDVELMPLKDLKPTVNHYVEKEHMLYMHPFDDLNLIAGYTSIGHELYEELNSIDIILVCCGGGGLVSGIAAYAKLTGKGTLTRIIAVEPEGACTMYLSLKEGRPVEKLDAKSIAGGLAPPFAGDNTYRLVREYVEEEVMLVSDEEIKESVRILYENGLVVEPSGAAGLTALRCGRVRDVEGKRIVVIISGSNVSPCELVDMNL